MEDGGEAGLCRLSFTCTNGEQRMYRALADNAGYTLVESLLHLSAFILLAHLSVVILIVAGKTVAMSTNHEEIEWELFSAELVDSLARSESLTIQYGNRGIQYKQNDELYEIEYYTNMIRRQKDGQGHEPLLLSVSHVSFHLEEHTLIVTVHFTNGNIKERSYVAPT